jgi:hypothetical protein
MGRYARTSEDENITSGFKENLTDAYGYLRFYDDPEEIKDDFVPKFYKNFMKIFTALSPSVQSEIYKLFVKEDRFIPAIDVKYDLEVKEGQLGPELETEVFVPEKADNRKSIVRIEIENTGDMGAYIDSIILNVEKYKILYMPESIEAGETSEALIELEPENREIKVEIIYSSEKLGCVGSMEFSEI